MPYEPAYEIATATYLQPSSGPPAAAVLVPHQLPPGVQLVTLPNGVRTLAYPDPPTTVAAATTASAVQPVPAWAKTTALLVPTTGVGIGAAGLGLSYAAPGLIAMSHALLAAVAVITATTAAAAFLLGTARHRSGKSSAATAPAQITQNITATGLFGRANGTIHHH